jgi:2-furoate---CoA ligase
VNLAVSLLAACERHPELEALPGLPYGELLGRTRRIAGGLDLEPGDRLAVVLDNRLETALLYWAAQWAGAVFVPLSWRVSDEELDYCLADSGARVVIRDGDELPVGPEHPGALGRGEHETSLLLYTSGTTGRPKGVPRSHRADRAGGLSQALEHGYGWADRTLGVMPLYHTMGIHSLLAMHLIGGCFVPQARWDPGQALALIEEQRITSLYLAPTLFHDLVHHPDVSHRDLSSVRALGYAGAAMTSTLVRRCLDVFQPSVFVNHYGSTEVYTFTIGRDQKAKPGCAGRPAVNTRLRLVDGEIAVHLSSDEAYGGYWNRPEADAKAIREGWYHTGDTGHLDEDGDLWIDGRVDDMIVSGGENVHPLEVEDVLAAHPGVREVAVVGAKDDRLGQRVVAVLVATATEDELEAYCLSSALARFKRPREYRFVDSLPKSPSGKILRRLLRDQEVKT